jgi:hypothetical protein
MFATLYQMDLAGPTGPGQNWPAPTHATHCVCAHVPNDLDPSQLVFVCLYQRSVATSHCNRASLTPAHPPPLCLTRPHASPRDADAPCSRPLRSSSPFSLTRRRGPPPPRPATADLLLLLLLLDLPPQPSSSSSSSSTPAAALLLPDPPPRPSSPVGGAIPTASVGRVRHCPLSHWS